jgi:tetratricopeptide (TPR) repeat protein
MPGNSEALLLARRIERVDRDDAIAVARIRAPSAVVMSATHPRDAAEVTIMIGHPDDAVLSAFSLGADSVADPDAVADHVSSCDLCQETVAVFRNLDGALRNGETWSHVSTLQSGGDRLAQFREMRMKVQAEDDAAMRILRPLLNSPIRFRNAKLAGKPRCHTPGMVRMLCAAANERHERQPKFGLLLTNTACTIAKTLPKTNESSRRLSMGMALRERANALRYLGQFTEALQSLDHAERFFDVTPGADDFDRAVVWYIRAVIFAESEKLHEGIAVARDAARVFHEYGDWDHELLCVMVEAGCLLFSGNAQAAADAFMSAAELSRERGNTRVLATALQNGAAAFVDLRQLDRAERLYTEALVLYDELHAVTEQVRTMWALGSVTVARGHLVEGASSLDVSRAELARLGLTNDASLATLEWAEARLALNQPEGVAEACRKIVLVFNSEGMQRYAKEALAVLHEALAGGKATPELVRSVRIYLDTLPASPLQRFVRPQ